jgi:hypothetical protein
MPARFVVLAISVVVAALGTAKFVPAEQHRHTAPAKGLEKHNDELCSHRNTQPSAECGAFLASVVFVAHQMLFTLAGQDEVG